MPPVAQLAALLRQLAANPKTRAQAVALAQQAAAWVAKGGVGAVRQRQGQRAIAELLARQTKGAKLSYKTVIRGQTYTVVWADDKPLAAFPPFEGDIEDELRRFDTALLVDPPPTRSRIWEPEWWAPPGKNRVWEREWWVRPGKTRVWTRDWWDKNREGTDDRSSTENPEQRGDA
jgi:hypothetical protein